MKRIAVMSAKGGVGKTTVAAALGQGLRRAGRRVAFCDCDVSNPNLHLLLGIEPQAVEPLSGGVFAPIEQNGYRFSSVSFLYSANRLANQVPMAQRARDVEALVAKTQWGEVDYLVLDTPPTTAEEVAVMARLDLEGCLLVTEDSILGEAGLVASWRFARNLRVPVYGAVLNRARSKGPHMPRGLPFLVVVETQAEPPHTVERLQDTLARAILETSPILLQEDNHLMREAKRWGLKTLLARGR